MRLFWRKPDPAVDLPEGFRVDPPVPGWAGRWARQGFALLRRYPAALGAYLAMMPLAGLSYISLRASGAPPVIVFPASLVVTATVCVLTVAIMVGIFERGAGRAVPKISAQTFAAPSKGVLRALRSVVALSALMTLLEHIAPPPVWSFSLWGLMVKSYAGGTFFALFFLKMGHAIPILSALGVPPSDNLRASWAANVMMRSQVRFPQVKMIVFWTIVTLLLPLTILAGPIFIAAAYVATRDVIMLPDDAGEKIAS